MIVIYQGLKYLWGRRELPWTYKPNKYFFYTAILLGVGAYCLVMFYGTKVPGAFLERDEYETMIYVRLYPYNNRVTSYKVPAEIRRGLVEDCSWGWDGEADCGSRKEYYINYAVMPNGGRIVFDEEPDFSTVRLKSITRLTDSHEKEWGVELTKEPVIVE